jgi:hypothetical protein
MHSAMQRTRTMRCPRLAAVPGPFDTGPPRWDPTTEIFPGGPHLAMAHHMRLLREEEEDRELRAAAARRRRRRFLLLK